METLRDPKANKNSTHNNNGTIIMRAWKWKEIFSFTSTFFKSFEKLAGLESMTFGYHGQKFYTFSFWYFSAKLNRTLSALKVILSLKTLTILFSLLEPTRSARERSSPCLLLLMAELLLTLWLGVSYFLWSAKRKRENKRIRTFLIQGEYFRSEIISSTLKMIHAEKNLHPP